jgi:hypothetical protein
MNKLVLTAVLLIAAGSSTVFAHGTIERLIDAQRDGIDYVISASYQNDDSTLAPEVGQIHAQCPVQPEAHESLAGDLPSPDAMN